MDIEQRIAALEAKVAEIDARFKEFGIAVLENGGVERVFQAAALALISTHKDKETLAPELDRHLEGVGVSALFQANNEEHLKAVQDAIELVRFALANGRKPPDSQS